MEGKAGVEQGADAFDTILAQLDEASRKLPVEAIQAARRHRDQIIPKLIDAIRRETENVRRDGKKDANAAFFALFLLAEFRAAEGLPAILEAISLPEEGPFILFGDAIHDVLPRVLVSLAQDQCIEVCSALVRNPNINEYVRWSAAKAIVYLAMADMRPRDEIVQVCKRLLEERNQARDEQGAVGLVMSMLDLYPWEACDVLEESFRLGLVDEGMVDWDSVVEHLQPKPIDRSYEYADPPCVNDTIEELRHWSSFQERKLEKRSPVPWQPPARTPPMPETRSPAPSLPPPHSGQRTAERVGRNDPCPCGSGQKFKRCCGVRK